jgi:hypothetical protein
MVYLSHDENKFSMGTHNQIVIMANVKVITGAQAKIILVGVKSNQEKFSKTEQLPRSNEYNHECIVPLKGLAPGVYLVRYYLDDICWATAQFEIIP